MRITVTRLERFRAATIGRLTVEGDPFECWTLEDPVRPEGIKIPGSTAIPAGTYPVKITWSPRFQTYMPLLIGVPNFSGVRIHPGNRAEDTDGCILVGMGREDDIVTQSRVAYQTLYEIIDTAARSGDDVLIEIVNQFERA